ncbi:MAG: tRNA-dihydrouridine synthase family protein [Ruminococcaceae bacterium]|nr:tRNA-dihydrouridine synthase family protein [Oscillospiraceae bacterium]
MKLYFAPMEGITTYTYRNAHNQMFGMCDKYYAPFIVPSADERITLKTLRDILPDRNQAEIVPQVLCNCPEAFQNFAEKVFYLGYEELNLNLGCPATTVVKKKRGAGALLNTESLDQFMEQIFSRTRISVSVKTRVGFYHHEEFEQLLAVYQKHPISLLIVHPRVREEFYRGIANRETFENAYLRSKETLCYNGDITTVLDYQAITARYNELHHVMIGRGAVTNPAIFREIKGGEPLRTEELIAFSDLLEERYMALLQSDAFTLHKLKEVWQYALLNFPEEKKIAKAVKKANRLLDLNSAIRQLPEIENQKEKKR